MRRMSDLQTLCALGQQKLMEMEYLEAEALLAEAEHEAWVGRDFDSLSRLYMPLQEARRQRRQRCGEGIVRLDLIADGPDDRMEARHVAENFPHGQLLVAGWKSIRPAAELRALQKLHGLYLETFLAAAYPVGERRAVVIVPLEDREVSAALERSFTRRGIRVMTKARFDATKVDVEKDGIWFAPSAVAEAGRAVEGLDARHGLDRRGTREPIGRGERMAVGAQRRVADHQRMPARAAAHHDERRAGLAAELFAHGLDVGGAQFPLRGESQALHHPMVAGWGGYFRLCSTARL